MNKTWSVSLVALFLFAAPLPQAQARDKADPIDPAGIARLVSDSGGDAEVKVHDATGAARFVKSKSGRKLGLLKQAARAASNQDKQARSNEFFQTYGSIFGVSSPESELQTVRIQKDAQGSTHITHKQLYRGLAVFGGELKSHYDATDELVAVNGTFVPDIAVDATPKRSADEAGKTAVSKVEEDLGRTGEVSVVGATLLVFREGLAQGVPGANHLAWQVEVASNDATVREYVYVDAHTGKFIDQITGTPDGLYRRAYDGRGLNGVPPEYPATTFWEEGEPFPTGNTEADNMILASKETYDFFRKSFGRDSIDGAGAVMDSIFNRGYSCPNASWNGVFISFCPGTTTDDITAHEWGHAYTQYTHNLIYQWQPGALNEAYSDIWGETVDRLNGRGLDAPGGPRTTDSCTAFTRLAPTLAVNSPAAIARSYPAGAAQFGPALTATGLTGDVVLVNDGLGNATPPTGAAGNLSVMDGCETPFANAAAVNGKIAMMYRGTCAFTVKVKNAQLNGAVGVIIGNHALGGNGTITMSGVDPTITIPSLSVGNANAEIIRAQLGGTVNATLRVGAGNPIDTSYRWLMGEESAAFGGAIRDMWNPNCYGNAGKVSDAQYTCSTADSGGVHSNSGVPNHAYALLVDGGTYNGQSISSIGVTKAAHIYFRASAIYQGPASHFADHADALEQSCSDLLGANLNDLLTGNPSGEVVTAADCAEVAEAIAAVELRTPPVQCNFQPLLAQNPPALCEPGTQLKKRFHDGMESGDSSTDRWSVSHSAVDSFGQPTDYTPFDWAVVGGLEDRAGRAFFGANPDIGTCTPANDQSGMAHLVSPEITIPASADNARLAFDHWVATEAGFDGGNVKISVNGGPWVLLAAADFLYNPYNATLQPARLANGNVNNTNPLAGQPAFSGTDGGSVDGTWGRSIVNLGAYAQAGDKIQLRFDLGRDGCTGLFGWYVDDVIAYTCE